MYFGLLSNIVINFSPWGKLANWHKNGKRKFNKIHHFLNRCVEGNNSTKELTLQIKNLQKWIQEKDEQLSLSCELDNILQNVIFKLFFDHESKKQLYW